MSILSTLNKLTGKQDKNVLAALNSLTGKTADDIEEAIGNLSTGGGGGSSSGSLTEAVTVLCCSPSKKDGTTGKWVKSPSLEEEDFEFCMSPVIATDKFDEMFEEYKAGSTEPEHSRFSNGYSTWDDTANIDLFDFPVRYRRIMGGLTFWFEPNSPDLPNWDHWDDSTDSMMIEVWNTKDKHSFLEFELLACYEYTGYTYDSDSQSCYVHVPRMDEILAHVPSGTDPKDLDVQLCIYVHGEATS